jgi:hypothetical protein
MLQNKPTSLEALNTFLLFLLFLLFLSRLTSFSRCGPKYKHLRCTSSNPSSDQLDPAMHKKYLCDLCDKEDHFVRNCPDLKRAAKLLRSYKRNQRNLNNHTRSKMTPTDHFNDSKLAKDNKKNIRSKKSKAYIADEDSASNVSSECNDDSDNDTDALVNVCYLSKECIKKAIPSELSDSSDSGLNSLLNK